MRFCNVDIITNLTELVKHILQIFSQKIQHQAFIEEAEVRLALLYDGGLPTRDLEVIGGVPRVGVRLKTPIRALLREVVIGPGPDMARNALVARALCLKNGLKIGIRESEIPFSGVSKR